MTDRELMQMALDALDEARDAIFGWGSYASPYFQEKHNLEGDIDDCDAVIEELRARLAQPEPEPVGFFSINDYGNLEQNESGYGEPFYSAPPQREENHDDDKFVYRAITRSGEIAHFGVYSAAKAWAKSGTVEEVPIRTFKVVQKPCSSCESLARAVMLDQTYHENIIAQREWQGLTDEEMKEAMDYWSEPCRSAYGGAYSANGEYVDMVDTWRYIEAKLKEKNA